MQLVSDKFNVVERGQHTLFIVNDKKPNKAPRDAEKVRLQLAHMLGVEVKEIVPNHKYEGLPDGYLCYRFKGKIPPRIRVPEVGNPLFASKSEWLHFVGGKPDQSAGAEPIKPKAEIPVEAKAETPGAMMVDAEQMAALIKHVARQSEVIQRMTEEIAAIRLEMAARSGRVKA